MTAKPHIILVAGEESGDQHGAELIQALEEKLTNVKFSGIGGTAMLKAGLKRCFASEDISILGITDIIKNIFVIRRAWKAITTEITQNKPNLVVLIDYSGFNLKVAKFAHNLNIKVVYYVAPQIWAWRSGRIQQIKRYVDHLIVVLPFEEKLYKSHHVPVTYVGSPLIARIKAVGSKTKAREILSNEIDIKDKDIKAKDILISLAPGSRKNEVLRLLPILVNCAQALHAIYPQIKFIIPVPASIERSLIESLTCKSKIQFILVTNSHLAIESSNLFIGASGTLTLECAILSTPMIIIHKISAINFAIVKSLLKIKYIGLCNIIANKEIVPECIQYQATPKNIVHNACKILDNPQYYTQIVTDLVRVKELLSLDGVAATKAAAVAIQMLALNNTENTESKC